jgi:hypothetical protein
MKAQDKQSLFDITVQNFGQMDELVNVSKDNNLSISELLETSQELVIGDYEGNEKVKDAIELQNITLNNNAEFITERVIVNKVLENGDNKVLENGDNKILE